MLVWAWVAVAADPPLARPAPRSDDWPMISVQWPCEYGSVRTCLARYQGPELCAAVRPLCDLGAQDACTVARSTECACLAGDAAACTTFAKRLAEGGDEAARVLKVLEDPCLTGVMTACTAITRHLLRENRPDLARPWLVFTCDRGEEAECARLAALPPER